MLQLYYYPNNASLAPHLLLKEIQCPFELRLVDRNSQQQKSATYLAVNPQGKIPTLVIGDTIISESAAICIHLCESYPTCSLMPVVGHPSRPQFYQWLMFLTNTVQAELMIYYYPDRYSVGTGADCDGLKANQVARVTDMFRTIDAQLEDKLYLLGDSISACDHFLFMLSLWVEDFETRPLLLKNVKLFMITMCQRVAVREVCSIENINITTYLSPDKEIF